MIRPRSTFRNTSRATGGRTGERTGPQADTILTAPALVRPALIIPALIIPALIIPALLVLLLVIPVLAGLFGALLPAAGYFPALGGDTPSLQPARDFLATPGLGRAVGLTLFIGIGTTALAAEA